MNELKATPVNRGAMSFISCDSGRPFAKFGNRVVTPSTA